MKPVETIRRLEVRNLTAIAICCGLALFIGFMLTGQFLYQSRMESGRLNDLTQDLDKRVTSVGYFFSERYADLENLGNSRELTGYFENQALGMSMKYGLKSSLYAASRRFSSLITTKRIGQDPFYRRIVFVLNSGEILIDTQGEPDVFPSFCDYLLTPGKKKKNILGDRSQIAVSFPFYFKGRYTGHLVSFLDIGAIDRNLLRHAGDARRFFCMILGRTPIFVSEGSISGVAKNMGFDPADVPENEIRITPSGKGLTLMATRSQVPSTPLSILALFQAEEAMSRSAIITTMAAFVLFMATAIFFIWRAATQRLILGVRLDESRKNENRFRDLVEFLPVPIWEYDFNLTLNFANREALEFFGFTREDIGKKLEMDRLVSPPYRDRVYERINVHARGENPGPMELELVRKNGKPAWGNVIPILICEQGIPVGIRNCFLDLTRQRRLEREAIKAAEQEKFALVGQVAGKMAHDFNNILSAIVGNAELTLLDCKDKEISATLEIILEQAKRGNILTRNLVAFSKDQEIREVYFNINDKMDLVLNLLKKDLAGIMVIKHFQDAPPDLLADPGMIEHALVNLVQNAVHAMAKTAHPVLGLSTASDGDAMTIVIQDNGCGIPEAYADEIYSPSFTLKGSRDFTGVYPPEIKGTGYGLSNVKKYIDKHNGTIAFFSREGEGTRFTLTLPLKAKALFPREKDDLMRKPVVKNKRILVVEDEPAISMVLCKILSSDPFYHNVSLAEDGEEALARIEAQEFNLVSLDYVLPGKMNGLAVYKHIRRIRPTLPVVFISGNLRFLKSIEAMKESDPFVDHLPKPFGNLVYADKMNQWLQADIQK